jgi:large subunit ribosomal protein L4
MKFEIYDGNTKLRDLKLSKVWENTSEKVLHQVVVSRLANERQGTAHTKTRTEVRGGGAKPWKQKGLGRARAGSNRSPLWKGGGVTFGPKPRDFSMKINKKQKSKAYIYVLSKMNELGKVKVVDNFKIDAMKTKEFLKTLSKFTDNPSERVAVVIKDYNKEMYIASRNLPNVWLMFVDAIDILPLVYAKKIIITEDALKELDARFVRILSNGEKK